jgi:DUF1365 family protein
MIGSLLDKPQLLLGHTWHARSAVTLHAFRYKLCGLLLPLRSMQNSTKWSCGPLVFKASDHGDPASHLGLMAWIDQLLEEHAPELDTRGEVWLQTLPRMLGFAFKPVSFWYCTDQAARVTAVLVEVNNTFGERHIYLLKGKGEHMTDGRRLTAQKVFHVSPFFTTQGEYEFRLTFDPKRLDRLSTNIDLYVNACGSAQLQIKTNWNGALQPVTSRAAWAALVSHPLQSVGVMFKIHWQAARLWLKHVPFFSKPLKPKEFVSS